MLLSDRGLIIIYGNADKSVSRDEIKYLTAMRK